MSAPVPKVVRNGKVAVLVSPGFGAGWSTWANAKNERVMLFSPEIVEALERGESKVTIETLAAKLFPDEHLGGLRGLRVEWIPVGQQFRIREYDGSESVEMSADASWEVA